MENLDWDLQAVVARGSCSSSAFAGIMENPPDLFDPLRFGDHHHHHHHHHHLQDDQLLNFPSDFLETTAPDFDWFEGIYNKPFCSGQLQHQRPPLSPQSMLTTTQLATSISAPEEVKKPKKESKKQPISDVAVSDRSNNTTGKATIQAPKSKRGRRNQCKRVVHHVVADGLSNDMWAWRKYGQKPVKGSPYPRSYYRCSSLKGCLARKQVERSSSDPSMFIVTYTAEHSHSHPTRRSALAGTTRTKVPMIRDTTVPSPKIPSVASTEHEVVQPVSIETGQEVQQIEDSTSGNSNVMPSLIFADESFPSLDDFEGLLFDFR